MSRTALKSLILMGELRFGVSLLQWNESVSSRADVESMHDFASIAEAKGFDSVFMVDHADMPLEAITTLSAVGAKTKRVRLGTAVIDCARRSPAILAQMTATLDLLSGGRLVLGLGKGVANAATYGEPVKSPVAKMSEVITLLRRFWSEETVTYRGKFYTFENASIVAKPIQRPHPPIWIAAFTPKVLEIVARLGDGWMTQNIPPEDCRIEYERLSRQRQAMNERRTKLQMILAAPVAISRDREEAFKTIEPTARDFLFRYCGPPVSMGKRLGYESLWNHADEVPREAIERCYIFGTPDDCISKIEAYKKAGVGYVVCLPILPMGKESLELFADTVLPAFKEG